MKQQFVWIALNDIVRLKGEPKVELGVTVAREAVPHITCPAATLEKAGETRRWPILPQARVCIGDVIEVHVSFAELGFLTLFSLGAGGGCTRLFPYSRHRRNDIQPGRPLVLPAREEGPWRVLGPATARHGGLEIFLAIVSRTPDEFCLGDINAGLRGAEPRRDDPCTELPSRGAATLSRPRLFSLPKERWEYGVVALEVMHRAVHPAVEVAAT
jgi:hypothetical protein